jgi:hypothetical protein
MAAAAAAEKNPAAAAAGLIIRPKNSRGFSEDHMKVLAAICEALVPPLEPPANPNPNPNPEKDPIISAFYRLSASEDGLPARVKYYTAHVFQSGFDN